MLTREQVVESLRLRLAYLAEEFGVRRIGLFGSFAKGLSTDKSDVDLIIEFDSPIGLRFMELGDYLEEVLGRRVDILTPVGLQAIRQKTVREDITESIVYVQPLRCRLTHGYSGSDRPHSVIHRRRQLHRFSAGYQDTGRRHSEH